MYDLLHHLLGIFICAASLGVFIERYGIPKGGTAAGYLAFGVVFVLLGVMTGKMLDASTLDLLLLMDWNVNISFMAIGYAAMGSGLAGLFLSGRRFLRGELPPE